MTASGALIITKIIFIKKISIEKETLKIQKLKTNAAMDGTTQASGSAIKSPQTAAFDFSKMFTRDDVRESIAESFAASDDIEVKGLSASTRKGLHLYGFVLAQTQISKVVGQRGNKPISSPNKYRVLIDGARLFDETGRLVSVDPEVAEPAPTGDGFLLFDRYENHVPKVPRAPAQAQALSGAALVAAAAAGAAGGGGAAPPLAEGALAAADEYDDTDDIGSAKPAELGAAGAAAEDKALLETPVSAVFVTGGVIVDVTVFGAITCEGKGAKGNELFAMGDYVSLEGVRAEVSHYVDKKNVARVGMRLNAGKIRYDQSGPAIGTNPVALALRMRQNTPFLYRGASRFGQVAASLFAHEAPSRFYKDWSESEKLREIGTQRSQRSFIHFFTESEKPRNSSSQELYRVGLGRGPYITLYSQPKFEDKFEISKNDGTKLVRALVEQDITLWHADAATNKVTAAVHKVQMPLWAGDLSYLTGIADTATLIAWAAHYANELRFCAFVHIDQEATEKNPINNGDAKFTSAMVLQSEYTKKPSEAEKHYMPVVHSDLAFVIREHGFKVSLAGVIAYLQHAKLMDANYVVSSPWNAHNGRNKAEPKLSCIRNLCELDGDLDPNASNRDYYVMFCTSAEQGSLREQLARERAEATSEEEFADAMAAHLAEPAIAKTPLVIYELWRSAGKNANPYRPFVASAAALAASPAAAPTAAKPKTGAATAATVQKTAPAAVAATPQKKAVVPKKVVAPPPPADDEEDGDEMIPQAPAAEENGEEDDDVPPAPVAAKPAVQRKRVAPVAQAALEDDDIGEVLAPPKRQRAVPV